MPSSDQPRVAVIVPCYEQAHFLADALSSVRAQTYANVAVVVVDDGSSDDEAARIATAFGAMCVRQDNRGLAAARNRGLAESQGELVVFLDADDRLLPDAIAIGVAELQRRPGCAFVSGDHRYIDRDGQITSGWCRPPIDADHYAELLKNNYVGMGATVMFRRRALEAVGGFDGQWRACEDYDLYLRLASRYPVHAHHRLVAEYRRYPGAMSDDPVRMLHAATRVLARQGDRVARDHRLRHAYAQGGRHWIDYYGPRALATATARARTPGQRLRGWRDVLTVVRCAPRLVLSTVRAGRSASLMRAAAPEEGVG